MYISFAKFSCASSKVQKKKEEEHEQKLLDDALNAMKKAEEAARLKKLQKEKQSVESKTIQTTKVVTVQEVIKPTEQKQFDKSEKKIHVTAKKYVSSESDDKWNKLGSWRKNNDTPQKEQWVNKEYKDQNKEHVSEPKTDTTKYIPPWKRAQESNQPSQPTNSFSSFSDYKQNKASTQPPKKSENKDTSNNNLSWRK